MLGAVSGGSGPGVRVYRPRAAEQGTVKELDERRDAEVFMKVDTTPGEIAAVRRAIRKSPLVTKWAFIDKDAAYKIFKRIFRDEPNRIKSIAPAVFTRVVPSKSARS